MIRELSQKEEPFKIFYPMAAWILQGLKREKTGKEREYVLRFRRLYPNQDAKKKYDCFRMGRVSVLLFFLFAFGVFSFFYEAGMKEETVLREGRFLAKPEEGKRQEDLRYESSEGIKGQIKLKLWSCEKTGEALDEFLFSIREQMESALLGENTAEKVTGKLNFFDEVAGYPVEWKMDTALIRTDGILKNEEIDPNGTVTILSGILQYYGQEIEFQIPIRLFPEEQSKEEKLQSELEAALKLAQQNTSKEPLLPLPEEIEGQKLLWKENKTSKKTSFFALFLMAGFGLIAGMECEIKNKEKKRKQQMAVDYPDIVRKMTLLLGAGMTIRGAWEHIVKEYERKRKQKFHFAYEEMRIAFHELELGISESVAYERFGKRCGTLFYLKFSTILVQNLNKGSRSVLPLLEQEVITSFNERRELAKRLGEEAGTKLLGPMMVLLILVLFLILVPAFVSFY